MNTLFGKIVEASDGSQSLECGETTYNFSQKQNVTSGEYYAVQGTVDGIGYTGDSIIPSATLDVTNVSRSFSLKNLAATNFPQNTYLNGLTQTGDIGLSPSAGGVYSGANWQADALPEGGFALKCLGTIHNPECIYLNALEGKTLHLAPTTTGIYIGTHWDVEYLSGGAVAFKWNTTVPGNTYINGVPQHGDVCFAPTTTGINIGTHWQVC